MLTVFSNISLINGRFDKQISDNILVQGLIRAAPLAEIQLKSIIYLVLCSSTFSLFVLPIVNIFFSEDFNELPYRKLGDTFK